jgi:hypothetical protein
MMKVIVAFLNYANAPLQTRSSCCALQYVGLVAQVAGSNPAAGLVVCVFCCVL